MTIELNCKVCGNNRFEFPASDLQPVLCQFCGESAGSYAEVKEMIAKAVTKRAASPPIA